jgi:SAM-dependent methyltransferase
MIEFYRVTDAFLFSNASWNSTRMKRELTNTVCRIMTERLPLGSKILCYGDGMGFDSAALAKCGFRVTCYEISELSLEFARRLFSLNELEVVIEREESRLAPGTFDAIVCLDVLEHLPDPAAAVLKFSNWLNGLGFLVVHAPFYAVEATQPTHLRSNRPLSGVIQGLYGKAGFDPLETGGLLLNPILLQKRSPNVAKPELLSRVWLRVAQAIVWFAKFLKVSPKVAAAAGSIPPYQWREKLVAASLEHQ